MTIAYCKNSNLCEVFAAFVGMPGPVNPDEVSTLRTRILREWPDLELSVRSMLFAADWAPVPEADQAVAPAWVAQATWEGRRWLGRWGHHLAALHRQVPEGDQYTTFDATMQPTLLRWLAAAREAYAFMGRPQPVATVQFGYVNRFLLDTGADDLSEWFRFNFAIEATGVGGGLNELVVGAGFSRAEHRARVSIGLRARQGPEGTVALVQTQVERDVPEGSTFQDSEALLAEVLAAKALAKESFFSFVTERALEYIGATPSEEPQT